MKKIKIDLEKENPLFTILKAGKIPVIRRSNEGFKNYNQKEYFDNHKDYCDKDIDYDNINGCFCLIGGIHGNWVTGAHYEEKLNIGYIEENTKVFATYTKDKKDSFNYMTAIQRYEEALYLYSRDFLPDEKVGYVYDIEDFELNEEIIVDAKNIKKVCEIEYKDFYKFLKFQDAGMLRIFEEDCLFYMALNNKHLPFVNLFGFNNIEEFIDKFEDLYKFPNLKKKIINIFRDYLFSSINEDELTYIKSHLSNIDKFESYINERKKDGLEIYYYNSYLSVNIDRNLPKHINSIQISIDFIKNEIKMTRNVNNDKNHYYWYLYMKDKISREKYDKIKSKLEILNEDQIFNKDNLEFLFSFYDSFNVYKECFNSFIKINNFNFLNKISKYKKLVDILKEKNINYNFEFDLSKIFIYYDENIIIEYDFGLNDFVLEIKENETSYFYNLEKIPDKYSYIKKRVNEIFINSL